MDTNFGASQNNSPSDDNGDEHEHTSNTIRAMYKLMYSLERNERRDGNAQRRASFGESTAGISSEICAQQLEATIHGSMPSPSHPPTRPRMERRHLKASGKKHREISGNGTQKEFLEEASIDEDNNGDPSDYQAFKRMPSYRHPGSSQHKALLAKKPTNVAREPEVIFFDSTAEKGTQTTAM